MARAAMQRGDYQAAGCLLEGNLAALRALGDSFALAQWLGDLGDVARCAGDDDRAGPYYEESLDLFRALGATSGVASQLHNLGHLAEHRGDRRRARSLFQESLRLFRALGDRQGLAECLIGLARVADGAGRSERAARLFGAAEAQLEALGTTVWPSNRVDYERIRAGLDGAAPATARAEGRARPLEQVLEEALADPESPARPPRERDPLSAREREVVGLVARGLTNRQVADELVVARSTVDRHVVNILRKLGLENRAQVAVWAAERGLLGEAAATDEPLQ